MLMHKTEPDANHVPGAVTAAELEGNVHRVNTYLPSGRYVSMTKGEAELLSQALDDAVALINDKVCHYCEKPAVAAVVCAAGLGGHEVGPYSVCADCRTRHEF